MNNIENTLITAFSLNSMKESTSPYVMIFGLFGIYIVKSLANELPKLCSTIIDNCKKRVIEKDIPSIHKNTSEIYFERDYTSQLEGYQMSDAIIDYICTLDQTK